LKPESIQEIEKNVCMILPDILRDPVVARNECALVAQEMRNTYFDGKPFDSSMVGVANVSD